MAERERLGGGSLRDWSRRLARSLALGLAAAAACSGEPTWRGWVYPDRNDLSQSIPLGEFESLESCRASAVAVMAKLPVGTEEEPLEPDYECGRDCRTHSEFAVNVCEETAK